MSSSARCAVKGGAHGRPGGARPSDHDDGLDQGGREEDVAGVHRETRDLDVAAPAAGGEQVKDGRQGDRPGDRRGKPPAWTL